MSWRSSQQGNGTLLCIQILSIGVSSRISTSICESRGCSCVYVLLGLASEHRISVSISYKSIGSVLIFVAGMGAVVQTDCYSNTLIL